MPSLFTTYSIEPLHKNHDRSEFDCDSPELNDYLQHRAGQDSRRKVSSIWIAMNRKTNKIAGFYTLSMAMVPLHQLPESIQKKLPRYSNIPAVRLGRLAVSIEEKGKGLGKFLLSDAIIRCFSNEIALAMFIVDAKNESAREFYKRFGFFSLKENPNHLYIPRATIEKALPSK